MSAPSMARPEASVAEPEARDALARVVSSAPFRPAPQLASFLTYIVEATLAGRQSEIKGYTIAVEALGRPDDFDPVSDPIVRVEAGRLRRALDQYYGAEGAADPVRIVVERGGYVPVFVRAELSATMAATVDAVMQVNPVPQPTVAAAVSVAEIAPPPQPVRPHRSRIGSIVTAAFLLLLAVGVGALALRLTRPPDAFASSTAPIVLPVIRIDALKSNDPRVDEISRLFSEKLSQALARFDEFVVVDSLAAAARGRDVSPAFVIEHRGQLAPNDSVVATMRLLETETGRVVWSTSTEETLVFASDPRELSELVRRLAVRIAQPYGVLHSQFREKSPPGSMMRCIVEAYDYWSAPNEQRHAQVRGCLERILQSNAGFHPAWSLLATIILDEHRIGYNARPEPLERAISAARRAVQLAPESARAQQSLMAILTVSGEIGEALKTGFDAVRRNPYDTDILADVGARLTQAGRGREGRPLLERAADLNQARPPWHDFYRFLAARQSGDAAAAGMVSNFLKGSEAPLALLGMLIANVDVGRPADAGRALRRLVEISPTFSRNPGDFLDRSFFAPDVRADILGVIERARAGSS